MQITATVNSRTLTTMIAMMIGKLADVVLSFVPGPPSPGVEDVGGACVVEEVGRLVMIPVVVVVVGVVVVGMSVILKFKLKPIVLLLEAET